MKSEDLSSRLQALHEVLTRVRVPPAYIAEHAPHPNAAILFADWFTSLEGQQAYQDSSGRLVPEPRVKSRVAEALKGRSEEQEHCKHGEFRIRSWLQQEVDRTGKSAENLGGVS